MEPTNQGESPQEVAKLSQVIQIDEGKIQAHLGEVVRSTVEETLNAMLDAEADRLCRAERYERTEARQDTRAGSSYPRQLHTKVGEIDGKVEGPVTIRGRLTVGCSGQLSAGVTARELAVYGKVSGNVDARDRVEIKRDGAVIGDI
jgi:hypothetical protein